MPRMIYGTAWKKERTTELVKRALKNGFRGIDTACQPKHYSEALVGKALSEIYAEVRRDGRGVGVGEGEGEDNRMGFEKWIGGILILLVNPSITLNPLLEGPC